MSIRTACQTGLFQPGGRAGISPLMIHAIAVPGATQIARGRVICRLVCHLDGRVLQHHPHRRHLQPVLADHLLGRVAPTARNRGVGRPLAVDTGAILMRHRGLVASTRHLVAAVNPGFRLQHHAAPTEGVHEGIAEPAQRHQAATNAEIQNTRGVPAGRSHATRGQGQREADIDQWVQAHVENDPLQAPQTFRVVLSQDRRFGDPPPQLNEHDGVEDDGEELGGENPEIVGPQSHGLVLGRHPALATRSATDGKAAPDDDLPRPRPDTRRTVRGPQWG